MHLKNVNKKIKNANRNALNGYLCESRNGIPSDGTTVISRLADYSHFFINLLLHVHDTGKYFIPSRLGSIHLAHGESLHNRNNIFHLNYSSWNEKCPAFLIFLTNLYLLILKHMLVVL